MTGLMLLQIESSNSASILLIQILLQHGVWMTRNTLMGGYLHRPICEIMVWCLWSWSGGVWKFL